MWEKILIGSFTSYVLTLLIVEGAIFNTARRWLHARTTFLVVGNKWLLDCRFCVCFWVSFVLMVGIGYLSLFLVVFGISHWLSTQERR